MRHLNKLVVKEKRGRKRYILFQHSGKSKRKIIENFFGQYSSIINGKIRWKIVNLESEKGIILVDHKKSLRTRELMDKEGKEIGIKPIKTSGTLKSLMKA